MLRRLAKNTLLLSLSRVLEKIFNIIFFGYAARVLGVEKLGIFSIVGTFLFFFSFLTVLGTRHLGIREIARNKSQADRFFNNILTLRFCASIAAFGVLIITIHFLDYPLDTRMLVSLAGITLIFNAVSDCFTMLYMAFERMEIPAVLSVFSSLFLSGLGILVLHLGYGLKGLVLVMVVTSAIFVPCYVWPVRNYSIRPKLQIDVAFWKQLAKWSLPFAILEFLSIIHWRIDILMISKLRGPIENNSAVGYYSPAYRLLSSIMIVPDSLRLSMIPIVATQLTNRSLETASANLKRLIKFLAVFLSFPLVIATTFFAPKIIGLFFGAEYLHVVKTEYIELSSAKALTILGWGYAFNVLAAPMVAVLLCFQRQLHKYVPGFAVTATLNVLLNLLLIPRYSYIGASIATLIAIVVRFLITLYLIRYTLRSEALNQEFDPEREVL